MAKSIQEIRQERPDWDQFDDADVVDIIRQSYFPNLSNENIAQQIGVKLPEPEPEPRSMLRTAGDYGISALKGAISVPETAVGLADIATGGRVGKTLGNVGFRPGDAKAFLDQGYSDQQKQAFKNFDDAEGVAGKAVALWNNPSVAAHAVTETLPVMAAGGLVGRGLAGLGSRTVSGSAGGVGPAMPGYLARTVGSKSAPVVAGAAGEGLMGAGAAAEQIRQESEDGRLTGKQAGLAGLSGLGTAAFGALGGKVAQRLGFADVDTMLTAASRDVATQKGVVRRMLEGAASEGVLEELPQSIQEQVLQNAALDRPLDEGVDGAAVLGMAAGGLMGAGGNALSRGGGSDALPAPDGQGVGQGVDTPPEAPRLLGNTPDSLVVFPDGTVGRRGEVEAYIDGLPEGQRIGARASLLGMGAEPAGADAPPVAEPKGALGRAANAAHAATPKATPEQQAEPNPADIVPEPLADTQAQIAAVRDPSSGKDSALITPNSRTEVDTAGLMRVETNQGIFVTSSPEKAAMAQQNAQALTAEQVGALLGYTTPKQDTDGTMVQARDADGNVVHEESTNVANIEVAKERARRMAPEGGSVDVTNAEATVAERTAKLNQDNARMTADLSAWSDERLSQQFQSAAAPEVRQALAEELGRRREAAEQTALQQELEQEQIDEVPGAEQADAVFANVAEDAGDDVADLPAEPVPSKQALPTAQAPAPETGVQPGDILNKKGKPFTVRLPAINAAKRAGDGFEAVAVGGGFVARRVVQSQPRQDTDIAADDQSAQEAIEKTTELTDLDRALALDKQVMEAQERLQALSEAGYGPTLKSERADLRQQVADLEAERDAIRQNWPQMQRGKPASFTTEAGTRLDAHYAVVDAGSLVTSHDENLRQNPAYPQELQPRARDRAASEMQVAGIAGKLDPARLGLSADAANGAPIVGADGLVESGNARTIALKRVYQADGLKAQQYREYLASNANEFGLSPEQVAGMQNPVLVRVRDTPVDRAEFARQANASTVAAMSPSEQAKSDAQRIDSMEDLQPDDQGDFSNAASRGFVRRFMSRLPATEQAGMVDSTGMLSTAGYARVRNAVIASAYGDSAVLQRMTESMDDSARNLSKALMMAAPEVAKMRAAMKAGARHDADITADVVAAVEELARLKEDGASVQEALAQAGMFGEKYSPETREMMQFLAENVRRPRRIAEFIKAYFAALDQAGDPNQGSLLGDAAAPTKGDLMQAARRKTQGEDHAASRGNQPEPEAQNSQEGEGAGRQGAEQRQTAPSGEESAGRDGAVGAQVEATKDEIESAKNHITARAKQVAGNLSGNIDKAVKTKKARIRQLMGEARRVEKAADGQAKTPDLQQTNRQASAMLRHRADSLAGGESVQFPDWMGSLGIPRAEMPQIKADDRSAFVQFLQARGMAYEKGEADPFTLKPTRAGYQPKKVRGQADLIGESDRSVLVSSDGHVVDGHHQWLAHRDNTEPVQVIRIDAPVREILAAAAEFPSAETSGGGKPVPSEAMSDRRASDNRRSTRGAQDGSESTASGIPQGLPGQASSQASRIERAMAKDLRRRGRPDARLFRVETIPTSQLPDALRSALERFREVTGTRVHIFRNLTPEIDDFNGVNFRDGVVHINENSQHPATLTAAHEWLHNLRRSNERLYGQLAREVWRQGRLPDYQQRLKTDGEPRWQDPDVVNEELTAAAVSDALTDTEFLRQLALRNEGVFRRVAQSFLEFLDTLTAGWRDQGSNAYLQDLQAFRGVLADVLAQVDQQAQGGEQAGGNSTNYSRKQTQNAERQGYLDGQPYEPENEVLSDPETASILDTFNQSAKKPVTKVWQVEDSGDIAAKSKAFQALAAKEGWTFSREVEGQKYFAIRRDDGAALSVRVSDHANVNRGHHWKESDINIAPDDGVNAYDTFGSALWKMRNATVDEDGETLIDGGEPARFSRKAAYAERDLIITHNLTVENLLHAEKMGGLAVPSLSVTRKGGALTDFGEITLVGDKALADPKGYAKSKVYGADIYSPRYPSVERQVDRKALESLWDRVRGVDGLLKIDGLDISEVESDGHRSMERDPGVMALFLKERGTKPDLIQRHGMLDDRRARLEKFGFGQYLGETDNYTLISDPAFERLAIAEYRDELEKSDKRPSLIKRLDSDEDVQRNTVRHVAVEITSAAKLAKARELDRSDTLVALEKQINDAGLQNEYQQFVLDELGKVTKREVIFGGFTSSGGKRYIPHTLENVVKQLKKDLRGGESFSYGVGSLRSHLTPQFKSVDQIRKAKDRLITPEQFEKVKKEIDADFEVVAQAIDPSLSLGTAVNLLEGAVKSGPVAAAKNFGYEIDEGTAKQVTAFLDKLRVLPTAYFEAKVLRDVDLTEFAGAVVPEGVDSKALDALRARGVTNIRTYPEGDEAARQAAVQAMAEADAGTMMFSRSAANPQTGHQRVENGAPEQAEVARVQGEADAIAAKWQNAPEVVVLADMQDPKAPKAVRDQDAAQKSRGAQGEPEGFFHDGKVYLVASQLATPRDTARVLMHEALGHYGLRGVFGNALDGVLRQVVGVRRGEVVAKARQYGLHKLRDKATTASVGEVLASMTEKQKLQAAEEVLAEMAQARPEIGFVRRAAAAIRQWLRQNIPGFQNLRVTDEEIIRDFILPARGWVERVGNQMGGASLAQAAFSRDGKGRLLAPNGEPSNLTEGQWRQVRTPQFKKWFGDWEAAARRKFLGGKPVKTLTGKEFAPDGVPLTTKVPQWYSKQGDSVVSVPGIGDVTLDERAVKSSMSHGIGRNKAAAFAAVPDVLRHGRIIHSEPMQGARDDGMVYQVAAPISLGDQPMVEVVMVKMDGKSRRMWVHEIALNEELRQSTFKTSADAAEAGMRAGADAGAIRSVLQNIYSVNPDTVSKVADGNDEPLVVYHGSEQDITQFDTRGEGDEVGAFFTTNPASTSDYTAGDGGNIAPVHLSISNPYEVSLSQWNEGDGLSPRDARKAGHDGYLIRGQDGGDTYIAFRPEQVKSATGNNGEFDGDNPDIRFSRGAEGVMRDPVALRAKAQQAVTDLFKHDNTVGWWHKTVGTMQNMARRSPKFARVYDEVQGFINDVSAYATEAADLAPNLLPNLETWRDIFKSPVSAADTKAIAAPIFEGTLSWARDVDGRLVKAADLEAKYENMSAEGKAEMLLRHRRISEGQIKSWQNLPPESFDGAVRNRFEQEFLGEGVVFTDAELRQHFKLAPKQIDLYREFRAATDYSLNQMAITELLRYGGDDVAGVREMALEAKTAKEASGLLRDHLLQEAGDNPDRRDVLIDTANKIIDKANQVERLTQRGYAPLSRFGQYTLDVLDENGDRAYFGMFENKSEANKMARRMRENYPRGEITQGTVSEQAYKLFSGITPETLELFGEMVGLESSGDAAQDKMFQDYLKLAKANRSAMKRLIHRKGIAGFNEDAGRVLAGFVYSNARLASTNLHTREISRAVADIPKESGQLKDMAVKLADYVRNPQEEAQAIRGMMFAQYLGGSLASAAVNMTQPFVVTMPYLSQWISPAKAAGQTKRALSDVFKKTTGDAKLDAALKKAELDGVVAPQEVHQLMAQARGSAALKSGDGTKVGDTRAKVSNAWSKAMLAWGKPFSAAEQFNRRMTYIAAYRTAVESKMADPDAFARRAIEDTQFVYNKGNKPQWARGAIGGTLFTFKQFSISYVELLHRLATQGGPEGRKAALFMLGMMFLVGGAGGIPFASDVEDVIDGIMQRLGYSWSTKNQREQLLINLFGKPGAEFVENGISGIAGMPIDIAGRLGMGNPTPGTGLLTKKKYHSRDMLELVGPAGDFGKRMLEGLDAVLSGKPVEGVMLAMPTAVRNLAKGVDMLQTGTYRDMGGRKVIDITSVEAIIKAIGFQPRSVADIQDATWTQKMLVDHNKLARADVNARMAKAIFEKDQKAIRKVREYVRDWNARNPSSPIEVSQQSVRRKVADMRRSKVERLERTTPKAVRAAVRDALAE